MICSNIDKREIVTKYNLQTIKNMFDKLSNSNTDVRIGDILVERNAFCVGYVILEREYDLYYQGKIDGKYTKEIYHEMSWIS